MAICNHNNCLLVKNLTQSTRLLYSAARAAFPQAHSAAVGITRGTYQTGPPKRPSPDAQDMQPVWTSGVIRWWGARSRIGTLQQKPLVSGPSHSHSPPQLDKRCCSADAKCLRTQLAGIAQDVTHAPFAGKVKSTRAYAELNWHYCLAIGA